MPEPNEAPQEPTTAELFAKAAEEIDATPEETEEPEAVTADEDPPEEPEETEESEAEASEETDEDEDNLPKLDQVVRDALGENAEALKHWDDHWKGVQKDKAKLAEREAVIEAEEKNLQTFRGVEHGLFNMGPDKAEEVLAELTKAVRDHHKADAAEEHDDGTFTYKGEKYYSQREVDLQKQIDELKANGADPEIEEIKAERRKEKENQARQVWVDSNSQSVIARVQKTTGGWGVTKEQIAKAYAANPEGMVKDPVQTMKREFVDEFAKWTKGEPKKNVKDLIIGGDAKGMKLPDDKSTWTFEQHLAAMEAE